MVAETGGVRKVVLFKVVSQSRKYVKIEYLGFAEARLAGVVDQKVCKRVARRRALELVERGLGG